MDKLAAVKEAIKRDLREQFAAQAPWQDLTAIGGTIDFERLARAALAAAVTGGRP